MLSGYVGNDTYAGLMFPQASMCLNQMNHLNVESCTENSSEVRVGSGSEQSIEVEVADLL